MELSEVKHLIEDQGRTWEEYKKANDERLSKLAKGEAVSELEGKLAKMDARLTEIVDEAKQAAIRANRLQGKGSDQSDEVQVKRFNGSLQAHAQRLSQPMPGEQDGEALRGYKAGMRSYLRKGEMRMSDVERKAINVGTDPQGGYLVEPEMDAAIDRVATSAGAMRGAARVVTIGSSAFEKLVKTSGVSAGGWGNETTSPSETATQAWSKLVITPGTVWAEPRASQQSLEDSVYDLEADLIDEIGITFADQESDALIDGTGVEKPRGILAYDMVANASYEWGKVGYEVTGGAAGFASSNPSDALVTLQHALKRSYRAGASWMMNDATLGAIRKFKDGQGIYLWAPSGLMGGVSGMLLGHPVLTDDYMPDLASNAYPVLFADFRRAYLIVDRRGTTILRDPFTAKPWIKFYATRRVGGGIANFEAVKALKCST